MNAIGLICTLGASILSEVAMPVKDFNLTLKQKAEDMLKTMYIANGIGLAAPQMGESIQLIVIDLSDCLSNIKNTLKNEDILKNPEKLKKISQIKKNLEECILTLDGNPIAFEAIQPFCFTNPKIEPIGTEKDIECEGCLSLPNVVGKVSRFKEIKLYYQDLDGKKHVLHCKNLMARCIQHECDHLEGRLFIDNLSKEEYEPQKETLNAITAFVGNIYDYNVITHD